MNNLRIKDVEITFNTRVFMEMLIFSGVILLIAIIFSYLLCKSFIAMICSWVLWITLLIVFNYLMILTHKIIKDIKIELSEEGEEEKVYTVMKVE